jgi:hypothetical protein
MTSATAGLPAERGPSRPLGFGRSRLGAGVALAALAGLTIWIVVSQLSGGPSVPSTAGTAAFEEKTGIRITRVAITGGGGLVDVRYRVIDPNKAPILHEPGSRLALREGDGTISTPFHLHSGGQTFQAGLAYYEILINTAGLLERGERVSVLVGDAHLDNVRVQ